MSEHVAAFIRNLSEYDSTDAAKEWLQRVLDPGTSQYIGSALVVGRFPESGFDNSEQYELWSAQRLQRVDRHVADMLEFEAEQRRARESP